MKALSVAEEHATDWLYYRVHEGSTERLDGLVDHVVRPAAERLWQSDPRGRWFFLRYLDASGLHLRLRLRAQEDVLRDAEHWLDRRLSDLFAGRVDLPGAGWGGTARTPVRRGASLHVYEPEFDKWDGPAGVALAEQVFQASSEFVLAEFARRAAPWSRLACATAVTARAVRLLPPAQRMAFLYNYTWYWCGQPTSSGAAALTAVRAAAYRAGRRLIEAAARVDPSPSDGYAVALDRALFRSGATRSPLHLLFHHVHLTNNRLGVTPREEAVIAEVLRTQRSLVLGP